MRASQRGLFIGLALLPLCPLPFGASAQPKSDWESAEEARNWKEVELLLPAYPKDSDLVEFFVSAASTFRFYLDPASISIGVDGVVRYALVARSPSGASNVSFDGIRCKTAEFRSYAFGRSDGTWSMRPTAWSRIQRRSVQRWHEALFEEYLCKRGTVPSSPKEIVDALKVGGFKR